ncbi:sugar phosphate isomerase/epimerase [Devosia rhodophyticola]|uniref:Sugar phosphate isomerase/epimerase n=1 Tax=Devosia rhodophyticola TaxID=3026423 RepID=A0ABY7Z009_9HYPH|nr:sugar phosphate isomerase/epimerase [Devosia rhodophyticola]WDR06963.1 sugar phosphate isomerase/epimerase [Devosia rhodophyticola]
MAKSLLSYQLWSSRKEPSIRKQLEVLAAAGYTDVQPHHEQYDNPRELRRMLDNFNLSARSAHIQYDMLAPNQMDRTLEAMAVLGVELVIMPWLPKLLIPTDRAGWQGIGEEMHGHISTFETSGMRFAWHNHGEELLPLTDGSYPIDHVLGDHLLWEIDIGWVLSVGETPDRWLERYSGRIPAVHVKDVPEEGTNLEEDGQITIGRGIVDWNSLWPKCIAAGAEIMVAEHDQPLDYAAFARDSIPTMKTLQMRETE